MKLPALLALLLALSCHAETPEEARLPQIAAKLPSALTTFASLQADFSRDWAASRDALEAQAVVSRYGKQLWQAARARLQTQAELDDRPLYWTRLALTRTVRDSKPAFPIFPADREAALLTLEQTSRGMDDIHFDADRKIKRILLTGFDPFRLDLNIDQSNPSGVAAMLLDGTELVMNGQKARIETALFPVRYADFDAGIVEHFLSPWLTTQQPAAQDWLEAARQARGQSVPSPKGQPQVDMVVTVSMGREGFDLERFPGRRRSALAPDNLGVRAGGSREQPVIPQLAGRPLDGAEFVEFSLPAAAMQRVPGPYKVIDNRWVTVVPNTRLAAGGLAALYGKTAVEGGGGGYLSNEISYRAVRLRDQLGLQTLPVGHIHTPKIEGYDAAQLRAIAQQLRALLEAAMASR
ncbi:hypothetical protein [Chitinimonas sp.]|uniref:hypothetical protein n=1 Tax=Chitinimonas sp. TaxID=1934313 RepID=UPI002F925E35